MTTKAARAAGSPFDDDGAAATDISPSEALPRGFGVRHLLALTALTAGVLSTYRALIGDWGGPGVAFPAMGIAMGGQLLVVGCVARWRLRGDRNRLQPGQWLSIGSVAKWLASMALFAVSKPWSSASPDWMNYWLLLGIGASIIEFVGYLWLAGRRGESRWWRVAFAATALTAIRELAGGIAGRFFNSSRSPIIGVLASALMHAAPAALQGLAIGIAMATDWRAGRRRHWSHWLGALCMFAGAATICCVYIAWYAFNPPDAATGSGS